MLYYIYVYVDIDIDIYSKETIMRTFCLANNKGGVTKTTTTVNLAHGLARAGHRILVIDTDAQCNSTYSLLGRLDQENTLFDVLLNGTKLVDTITSTKQEGLY